MNDLDMGLVMQVAARAAGEAQVCGFAGVRAVAGTIWNRLASPAYPDTLAEVLQAYFAPDVEPVLAWHVEAALSAHGAPDLKGFYYALSTDDLRQLNVEPGQADYAVLSGRYGIYLFRRWPVG